MPANQMNAPLANIKKMHFKMIQKPVMRAYSLTKEAALEYDHRRDVAAGGYHGRGKLGEDGSNERLSHTKTTRRSGEGDATGKHHGSRVGSINVLFDDD